ncbi:retrotransposon protein, putative, ty1-copia subclass [Tanacetum coccineum]
MKNSTRAKQEGKVNLSSSYFLKKKSYIDQLERLFTNTPSLEPSSNLILLHEETLPKKVVAPALHAIRAGKVQKNKNKKPSKAAKGVQGKGKGKKAYANAEPSYAPKPKNPPPPKKDNPAKDAICHHCGEVGHWRRNCPTYLTELLKKKQLSQGASTSVKKLNPGALSLYMGNGQRAAVEAIGNYHLCLPSGLVIVLNNCHYAPSITRGIISVSRLYEDGFINRFELNNAISVSKNNECFILVLSQGMVFMKFEIHISKKRIEKLQHEGLLNSNDIESLGKCVSCMSRKMARKPYSHQVKRAKDLLGLIHIDALVKHDTLTKPDKMEPRSFKCIFIGYPKETMGYSFYNPSKNKVFVARNAEFFKSNLIDQEASPLGQKRAPYRLCLYIDAEEHELGDLGEPTNYKAALKDPKSEKWQAAMNVEMKSMKDNDVWELVELPLNAKTVGHKWLFKKKTDMDGAVHTFKSRLVAKGFTQTYGVDYEETFSHVADIRAIRILIAIVAFYDYEIWQMDVKTTFLNGHLFEEVYITQPEGEAAYILGIKIYRDRSKRLIGLCKSAYIEKILKRYYMENSKRGTIPMQEKLKLSKSDGASTPAKKRCMSNVPYASAVGSIMYANPGELHWTTVKDIPKYLQNTKDVFLVYGGDIKRELRVSCYTDVGYMTDANDLKSQTGYVFVLNGGVVDWKSTKQNISATSSTNAKYITAFDASKEAAWIRKFISGLNVVPIIEEPITMYCDNTGAITIANDHGVTKGA